MLSVLGSSSAFNRLVDRRQVMRIGAAGLGLPQLFFHESLPAAESTLQPATFGRAKNILLLYLQGAASQFETWDPKPDAPAEIRGQWGATATSVPGIAICDQLPKLSALAHRMAIVRSMTHGHNNPIHPFGGTGTRFFE
jgi:Protein of unknown function (DUF1501)